MTKQAPRTILLAVAVALFACAPAFAVQRYASPTGTGPVATCASGDPCSLANALNNANLTDLDEVILATGDYAMGATGLSVSKGVDIHGNGAPGLTRIISTASTGLFLNNANVKLRNIEIAHTVGAFQAVTLTNGTLDRVIVKSQDGSAVTFSNGTIRDSILVTRRGGGFGVGTNTSGLGTYNLVLRNVTAIGAGSVNSYGIFAGLSGGGTMTIDAKSVIARGTTYDVYAKGTDTGTSTTVTLDHSNFASTLTVDNSSITSNAANNNQTTAPAFVNAAGDDYHQASGSATIDAGATDANSGFTDVDGATRVQDSFADIGGDEFEVPPLAPSITSPAGGSVTGDTTPAISGTAEANSTINVFADGNPAGSAPADSSGAWSLNVSPALAEGTFSLTATATDSAPTTSPLSSAVTLTVDTTAPAVAVTAPAAGSITADNTPQIAFSATDAHIGTNTCAVDGGTSFACASGDSLLALADGSHTLTVVNTDTAGNAGNASTTFSVDTTAPGTKIGKKPKARSKVRKAKFTFSSTEAGSTFRCKLDKGAFKTCRSPFSKRVKPGKHTLRVAAVDALGHTDASPAVFKWKVLAH